MSQNYETSQNEIVKVEQISSTDKKNSTVKRKNKLNPMYSVLTKARKDFGHQKQKDTSLKIECIQDVILRYYDDKQRFWADFNKQARKLVVISTFCEDCKKLKLDPQSVAEHVVFRGKKDFEIVRDEKVITKAINDYIPLVNLKYICSIKDAEGNIVGFAVLVPSIAKALKKCNGRM